MYIAVFKWIIKLLISLFLSIRFCGGDNSIDMYQHGNVKIRVQEKRQKWSQFPFKIIQDMKCSEKVCLNCLIFWLLLFFTIFIRMLCFFLGWKLRSNLFCLCYWYREWMVLFFCVVCHHNVFRKSIAFDEEDVQSWWCEFCQGGVNKVSARSFF